VKLVSRDSDGVLLAKKEIDISNLTDEEKKKRICEAKILEVLDHPNITRFVEQYKTKK